MSEAINELAEYVGSKLGNARRAVRQATCRHDFLWTVRDKRTFLKCANCGKETAGWTNADLPKPTLRFAGDPERFRMVK